MRGRGLKPYRAAIPNVSSMSPPMRGRGLKRKLLAADVGGVVVAPHAGAWIETRTYLRAAPGRRSPPMRGRGLKLPASSLGPASGHVAPHAGAWIETHP